jgi:hypothetical protein
MKATLLLVASARLLLPISAGTARQPLTLSDAHTDGSTASVAAIDRYIKERNEKFQTHSKARGRRNMRDGTRIAPVLGVDNCKDPLYYR